MIQHLRSLSSDTLLRHAMSQAIRVAQVNSAMSTQLTPLQQTQRGTKRGREPEAIDAHKSSGAVASPAAASSSSSLSFNPTLSVGLASTLRTSAAAASTSDAMDESVDMQPVASPSTSAVPAAAGAASSSVAFASPVVSSAGAAPPSESLASSLDLFRSSLVVGSLVDVRVSRVADVDRFDIGEVTAIDFANARVTVLVGGRANTTEEMRMRIYVLCKCAHMMRSCRPARISV
jgi:hypothetical protein